MDATPKWEYIVLYLIPLGTIWGNVLVCLAVYLERRLRHRFNLFLVSLAISDLLCALLVMPVSAWQMITGGSSRDRTLCLIWYSMDIFFTATTIIHLCSISLDRYLALRGPFTHNHRAPRTFHSLIIRIVMSWFIPFSIAGPLFLFALQQQEQELERVETRYNTSHTMQPLTDSPTSAGLDSLELTKSYKGCGPNDPSFVLTAIGVTFVLPLIIMTATYVLTVRMLRQHMQQVRAIRLYNPHVRSIRKPINQSHLKRALSERTSNLGIKSTPTILLRNLSVRTGTESRSFARESEQDPDSNVPDQSCEPGGVLNNSRVAAPHDSTPDHSEAGDSRETRLMETRRLAPGRANGDHTGDGMFPTMNRTQITQLDADTNGARLPIAYPDYPSSSPSHRTNVALAHFSTFDRIHSAKRAVRVIGVLFALFVTCYLPFFIVYIIDVLCLECKWWTGVVIPHLEWLGYLSSMLNPVVYHSFNSTFRRTFRRIFRCACRSIPDHHAMWCRRVRI